MTATLVDWTLFLLVAMALSRRACHRIGISNYSIWFDGLTAFLSIAGFSLGMLLVSWWEWSYGQGSNEEVLVILGTAIGALSAFGLIVWWHRSVQPDGHQRKLLRPENAPVFAGLAMIIALQIASVAEAGRSQMQSRIDSQPFVSHMVVGAGVTAGRVDTLEKPTRDAKVVYIGYDLDFGSHRWGPIDLEIWRDGRKIMSREIAAGPGYVVVAVQESWLVDGAFKPGTYDVRLRATGKDLLNMTFIIA